ncbi:MAG TPA: M1 family aminopeptidase, partial [Candidatus Wallbacteria bacterium]|nr:M1 family aminopeptidase [Candidatus Wallbacteria bacterium]
MTKSTFRIFLLSFLFLLHVIPAAAAAAKSVSLQARPDYAAVEKYIVTLDLLPQKHMVSGEVEIIAPPGANFSGEVTLNLHEDMDVRSLSVFPGGGEKTFKREGEFIKTNVEHGVSKIFVSFYGDPSRYITPKNSFTYIGKEGCYFDDLCSYFPRAGFDQKSFFELSVVHDKSWTPISQGELVSSHDAADGRTVSRFVNGKKSRCHTLAAGPYSKMSSSGETPFKINVFFYEKDSEAAEAYLKEALSVIDFYRSGYGDNGIKTLNIVEVEKVFPGGYGPEEVVYITAAAFGDEGADIELLAHEIAHQWFGNFVLGEFPESNFLNEAFATYASLEYVREKHGAIYQKKYDELRRRYLSYRFRAGKGETSIADASKNPTAGFSYQALMYYRGMMVLKSALYYMGLALDKSQSSLVRDYLSDFAEKTLTVEDFKNHLFDRNSKFFSEKRIVNEKAFEKARFVFDSFYGSTAAIELNVNGAFLQKNSEGSFKAIVELERTDGLNGDFEMDIAFYGSEKSAGLKNSAAASKSAFSKRPSNFSGNIELISGRADYKLIGRKTFTARRGVNNLEFDLPTNLENIKYIIAENNDHLISYDIAGFGPPPAATDSVAVFSESSGLPQKFRDFCRELAGRISCKTLSDNVFNPRDFLKYANIILIGDFSESPLKQFITQNFNVDFDSRNAVTKNCFNERFLNLDNGVSAEFNMKNPFVKNGSVNLLLFSNQPGSRGYTHLNRSFNDYCLYDIFSKKLKADSFNYGLSGSLSPAPQTVKVLYSSAGLDKNYISGAPATLLFDIYNASRSTVEAVLATGDERSGIREERIFLAPERISRHESRPMILSRNSVDFELRGAGGIILEKNVLSGTVLAPRTDSYAVCAPKDGRADSIVSAINF